MNSERSTRRARGAFYTPPELVAHLVGPALIRPWSARIAATPDADLPSALDQLAAIRVFDPACGDGALLAGALGALRSLEAQIRARWAAAPRSVGPVQLVGFDRDPAAVAAAAVRLGGATLEARDGLHGSWPHADVLLANPPFIGKNRLQRAIGLAAVQRLREAWPQVPGGADYCVYFLRRMVDALPAGGTAAIIVTRTAAETVSRRGGLDALVRAHTITDCWPDLAWPGDADVRVAVVCWSGGRVAGPHRLHGAHGPVLVDRIGAHLSDTVDVSSARALQVHAGVAHQGLTHGHAGLLLTERAALDRIRADPTEAPFLRPLLTADGLLSHWPVRAPRRVVLLPPAVEDAPPALLARVREAVWPDRQAAAQAEAARKEATGGRGPSHHARFLARWWRPSWPRDALLRRLQAMNRYIAVARVTTRPHMVLLDASVVPSDVIVAFALDDDYSYGVLQSAWHLAWLRARCSTLGVAARYTTRTVFASFPWPPGPTPDQVSEVADAAVAVRLAVAQQAAALGSLRAVLRSSPVTVVAAQARLDAAVDAAYRHRNGDRLAVLLTLNLHGAAVPAGLPVGCTVPQTTDCLGGQGHHGVRS
ncbi:MAG: hypothetical protein ACI9K2_006107 [Myxococcota bacterium]|jgi:hypothetical protein